MSKVEQLMHQLMDQPPHQTPTINKIVGKYSISVHLKGQDFSEEYKSLEPLLESYMDFVKRVNKQYSLFPTT